MSHRSSHVHQSPSVRHQPPSACRQSVSVVLAAAISAAETSAAPRVLVFVGKGTRGGVCVVYADFSNPSITYSKSSDEPPKCYNMTEVMKRFLQILHMRRIASLRSLFLHSTLETVTAAGAIMQSKQIRCWCT